MKRLLTLGALTVAVTALVAPGTSVHMKSERYASESW